MNDHEVCFITCVNDQEQFSKVEERIRALHVPDGMKVEIVQIRKATSITSGYNTAMQQSEAKYKVYLHQDLYIMNDNFIVDILKLFTSTPNLGMLGVIGAKELPISGIWWEAKSKFGKVLESHTGVMNLLNFQEPLGAYERVEALDGLLLVTQYDVPWREDLFEGWHFYDASQCFEFIKKGYEVGIPKQAVPWCTHDCGLVNISNGFAENQQLFRQEYGLGGNFNGHTFHRLGKFCRIDPTCDFYATEGVSIGDGVKLQKDCWVMLPYNNYDGEPRIRIGDGCDIGRRCNITAVNFISIGRNVITAPNVHITDHNHEYHNIDIPIMHQGITSWSDRVSIGDGSWIGINAVIVGNVSIGKGCVIAANSVVVSGTQIPDYCVVAGAPAQIVKQYNKQTGTWVKNIKEQHEQNELTKQLTESPLISICIPTYNREKDLEYCLESIFNQIGNDSSFEIIVSDNCSTDSTLLVLGKYNAKYTNFRFSQNSENIGADANIHHVMTLASGKYVMPHGDDDFFLPGTLRSLFDLVKGNEDCGVIFLDVLHSTGVVERGFGMNDYLDKVSIYSTFISGLILRRESLVKIDSSTRFIELYINQVYLQFSILAMDPNFCVYHQKLFGSSGNMSGGYNFAEVFIKNYLEVLNYFGDKGLDPTVIAAEKSKIVYTFLLWWYGHMLSNKLEQLQPDKFEPIFIEAYKNEPYFPDIYKQILEIKSSCM
ncbi:acetyltransferase-like isoleucine patch superfamily enzyme/glycosyltransferase involved in cell wall biosynthesis [Paenibacillus anaericanus]|uniref:glycosyltransferase n=1 Tax=Paenibacillus anaericanus TaxID=170367 RepID=UPI002780C301|nr:glycosyltransferase [Paenibacillus anaericanus]MDQ0087037.1 acetyltransferase-like isoleucine patch superfamily enzyme/glycosyltransferase involved in cell wall biosynthesis [Paenibacillus anaericanus]